MPASDEARDRPSDRAASGGGPLRCLGALLVAGILAIGWAAPTAPRRTDAGRRDADLQGPEGVGGVDLPILTFLGTIGTNGRPVGVIGGPAGFRLQAPAGKTFREVVWEVEGAMLDLTMTEHGGAIVTPLPDPYIVPPSADGTESVIQFYWDATPGDRVIDVTAFYTDGSVGKPDGIW
jgi:hypothetical protein